MTVEIRRAHRDDAETLTAIAHAAKRNWHYPEEWLRLWAEELTVTPDFIENNRVYCAQRSSEVVGFYALSGEGLTRELDHLWVAPEQLGAGVGAALFVHAARTARAEGASELRIASDPNAEGFYVKMGARRAGEVPSRPAGRTLPLLVLRLASASIALGIGLLHTLGGRAVLRSA